MLLLACLYLTLHPYAGIVGDAALYLGRSLADLDPAGVGRDIVFVHDGQSRFSIFSRVVDPLVAFVGVERASLVVSLAASACVFAATLALAHVLGGERRRAVAIAVVAIGMPTAYGAGIFHFAETEAVPRPFAEAAVLAFVAALLADRRWLAGAFLALASVFHPIMAMAGVGTVLVLAVWRRRRRAGVAVAVGLGAVAGLALALGAAGLPLFGRLVARVDPEWLGMLTDRSPHLFPSLWGASSYAGPLVQATTVLLAARRQSPGRRRVLLAIVVSALLQLAFAVVCADGLHGLLAVQGQAWRALWLLAEIGAFCLPLVAVGCWDGGAAARVALALLGLAWLCPIGLAATIVCCAAAIALQARPDVRWIRDAHATWVVGSVVLLILLADAAAIYAWAGFNAAGSWNGSIARVTARQADLLVAPLWLATAASLLLRPPRTALTRPASVALAVAAAAVATAAAAATWDERGAIGLWARQDVFPARTDVPGPRASEVLVVGGMTTAWFALGRPQFFSPEQAVSMVFSRPLAMEWRRRARALESLGLVPHNMLHPWDPLLPSDHIVVTEDKIAALCRREDAPAAVVVPDRDDAPAPALPGRVTWTAAQPLAIVENYRPPQWHVIRGWIVVPCAGALAKSSAG